MTGDEIREAYLGFFEGHGHLRVASSPLIPIGDPTLLLTSAGMVQFKPYFTGEATPPSRRLTSSQKCFRTSDIDEVGDAQHLTFFEMLGNFSIGDYFKREAIAYALEFVTRVLGLPQERFSITIYEDDDEAFDYWRQVGIPAERIYRFGDKDNWWGPAGLEGPCGPCSELHYDFGAEYGCVRPDCGPNCPNCGRFVELWNLVFMQFYHHLDGTRTPLPAPNIDTGMGLERTAVVMQGKSNIYQTDLFAPILDRVAALSGRVYGDDRDTDYAMRVVAEHGRGSTFLIADGVVPGNEGRGYVLRRLIRRAIRHGRRLGLSSEGGFLGEIAQVVIGHMSHQYPELKNHEAFILKVMELEEERFGRVVEQGLHIVNAVCNKMERLRKAREEDSSGKIWTRFEDLVESSVEIFKNLDPRLTKVREDIWQEILDEENRLFEESLIRQGDTPAENEALKLQDAFVYEPVRNWRKRAPKNSVSGTPDVLPRLEEAIHQAKKKVSSLGGQVVFLLHDTYGFPPEVTAEIAREHGLEVDMEAFEREMEAQRERARASGRFDSDRAKIRVYESLGVGATSFLGYQQLSTSSVVVGLIVGNEAVSLASQGQEVEVVLQETPFYAEMGGQVGDAGELVGPSGKIRIEDTQSPLPDMIVHFGRVIEGAVSLGETAEAHVDPVRREDIARNHTATHMLHAALRQVLGSHVRQAGSLVAPDRLRFDFTHVSPMSKDELRVVQRLVNDKIRQNVLVHRRESTYTAAIHEGALAFFGDKYGDIVRVVEVADGAVFSLEVCGGTHVERTGEIGACYVLGEASIGSGMRRIEAVTGRAAENLVWERFGLLDSLSRQLQAPLPELEARAQGLLLELDQARKRSEGLERSLSRQAADGLLSSVQDVDGIQVLAVRTTVSSSEALREMGDWLRDKMGSGIVVIGSILNDRPTLVAMVTPDLVARGLDAGHIARGAAKAIGGGGGGRPELAQAGGRRKEKLDDALRLVPDLVRQKMTPS